MAAPKKNVNLSNTFWEIIFTQKIINAVYVLEFYFILSVFKGKYLAGKESAVKV
jgi:hypothetical protein